MQSSSTGVLVKSQPSKQPPPLQPRTTSSSSNVPPIMHPTKLHRLTGKNDHINTTSSSSTSSHVSPPKPVRARPVVHPLASAEIGSNTKQRMQDRSLTNMDTGTESTTNSSGTNATTPPRSIASPTRTRPIAIPATIPTGATPTAAASSSSSSAASRDVTSNTTSNIVAPIPSSSSSTTVAPSPTVTLADRVVRHWRDYTRDRVQDLSLDHRAQRFLLQRHLHQWLSRTRQTKKEWKEKVRRKTKAKFHYLKVSFDRWRLRVTAKDRPSIQRRTREMFMNQAQEFCQYHQLTRAIQAWKSQYAYSVLWQDHHDQAEQLHSHHLLRDLFHSWRYRLHLLHRVEQTGNLLTQRHRHHLLFRAYRLWRSNQESSSLTRLQAGVARKFAYRSTLKRMMHNWRREVGRALAAEHKAVVFETQMKRQLKRHLWSVWCMIYQRQLILGRLLHHCQLTRIRHAKLAALAQWHAYLLHERHGARLYALGVRHDQKRQQHLAIQLWRQRIQLWRVQRLRGAAALTCMQHSWSLWRRALATVRTDRRRLIQAADHSHWHGLSRGLREWKKFTVAHKLRRILRERAEQVWQQHIRKTTIQQWHLRAQRSHQTDQHRIQAIEFAHHHQLRTALTQFRRLVTHSDHHAQHHRLLIHHQRHHAFQVWRRFTAQRHQLDQSTRRAKRFRYHHLLALPFRLWKLQKTRERALEQRLLQQRGQPLIQRLKRQLLIHWSTLARISRTRRIHNDLADQTYHTHLRRECFHHWFIQYELQRNEREFHQQSIQHFRHVLLTRVFRTWDSYTYAQRDVRRRMQDGIRWIQHRLREMQRKRLFAAWKQQFQLRQLHHHQYEQAELHHARVLIYRTYRTMQHHFARKQAQLKQVALLADKVGLRHSGIFFIRWRHALAVRRHDLHKNVLALRFWSQRIQQLAWRGWMKYHKMKRWKKHLLQQALDQRRQKLAKEGLRIWLRSGLALHETELEIAQRSDTAGAFATLHHRRLALRCVRLWREKVRQHRQQDQRMGINRRVVHFLPFNTANYEKARPLPISAIEATSNLPARIPPPPTHPSLISLSSGLSWVEEKDTLLSPPSLTSPPDSTAITPIPEPVASLFPSLPKNRLQPRKPVDLLFEFPIQLPLQPITLQPRAAPPLLPIQSFQPPVKPLISPLATAATFPILPSSIDPTSPVLTLESVESHLHRLMEWKKAAKQRQMELLQLQQRLDQKHDPEVQEKLKDLNTAVIKDQEQRSEWQQQVLTVQQQLQRLISQTN